MNAGAEAQPRKVVVNLGAGKVIRGLLKGSQSAGFEDLLDQSARKFPKSLSLETDDGKVDVNIKDAKAVFFVKSFEGDFERHGLRFYTHGPIIRGIWVEIQFKDNEVVEGIVENSIHHILDDGFLLSPSDPESNNLLIYINKSAMQNYRVLGVRTLK